MHKGGTFSVNNQLSKAILRLNCLPSAEKKKEPCALVSLALRIHQKRSFRYEKTIMVRGTNENCCPFVELQSSIATLPVGCPITLRYSSWAPVLSEKHMTSSYKRGRFLLSLPSVKEAVKGKHLSFSWSPITPSVTGAWLIRLQWPRLMVQKTASYTTQFKTFFLRTLVFRGKWRRQYTSHSRISQAQHANRS